MTWSVKTICHALQLKFSGEDLMILRAASLKNCLEGNITFIKHKKFTLPLNYINRVFVVPKEYGSPPIGASYIYSDNPKLTFSDILELLYPAARPTGDNNIGPGTLIEDGAVLGKNSTIGSNCVIKSCVKIGDNCNIKSGTIIGEDGFGFEFDKSGLPIQVRHVGGVIIGNHVNIGSNCTIDRGMLDDTTIGDYVKIDNQVHVGHNCIIRNKAVITACAELSGGVVLNERAWVAPNASILQRIDVGSDAMIGIGASVIKDVKPSERVSSMPAMSPRQLAKIRGAT